MTFKRYAAFALAACALALAVPASAVDITGAGATFPYPIYAKWAEAYKAKTGVGMNYQSIGSGGGIKQIQAKTVDFGASDMPLKPEELEKDGLVQFPAVIGGVVPVDQPRRREAGRAEADRCRARRHLSRQDQEVERPSDCRAQPDAQDARPEHHRRAPLGRLGHDVHLLTDYLSKVSPEWKDKVGEGTSVAWPAGVGGKGNEGVASYVQRIKGSIGYVEYAYAKKNKMSYAQLQEQGRQFRQPDDDPVPGRRGARALERRRRLLPGADRPAGQGSWPITGAQLHPDATRCRTSRRAAQEVLKFFDWALKNGAEDGRGSRLRADAGQRGRS